MLIWMYLFRINIVLYQLLQLSGVQFLRSCFKRSIWLRFTLIAQFVSAARIISEAITGKPPMLAICHFFYLVVQWLLSSDHETDHILSEKHF